MLQNTQALKPTVLQRLSFRQLQTLNENPPKGHEGSPATPAFTQ